MTTRKVFIVHHSEDIGLIQHVIKQLEKRPFGGLKVEWMYDSKDFIHGKPVTENIATCIGECDSILVCLTKGALERNWVKYETLLALEKSQRQGRLCVTLVLLNLDPKVAEQAEFGLLTNAMMIPVDFNKNWEDDLVSTLVPRIREPTPLGPIQVAANLSVGQVWSHLTGYSRQVLPKLKELIRSDSLYQDNIGRFPELEFDFIPTSAKTVQSLSDLDQRIKFEKNLRTIKADRGSYKDRTYKVPVYSIEDPDTNQRYYFVAQIPNTLSILSKLENQSESADDKRPALKISKGERSLQVSRFYFAYNRLVNHPHNEGCNNTVKLICYNDSDDVVKLLLKTVKQECERMKSEEQLTEKLEHVCIYTRDSSTDFSNTVYIDFHPDCPEDIETGQEVKKFLQGNKVTVWEGTAAGTTDFKNFQAALQRSKWLVYVLSSNALHKDDCRLLMFQFRTALHESVQHNEVRVIPILVDVCEEDIPGDLSAVTYLRKQEPNYLEKLLKIIQCGSIKMEATVTAKDVHQGLAWAYVINYLEVTLEDRNARLKKIKEKYPSGCLCNKLFILVPKSCDFKSLSALDVDQHGQQIDPRFKQLDEIVLKTTAFGGVTRDYQFIPYSLQDNNKEYIVVVECCNAVLCLKEMSELSVLSGLDDKHLCEEARKFKELTQSIIDCTASIKNKVQLLYYDDSSRNVAEVLLDALREESDDCFLIQKTGSQTQ